MAVPSLVANSPSAGYISWSAFHITYNGVSYSVPASNTNATFTAWLYNGGSPLLVTNNNAPTNTLTDATSADWAGTTPILGPDDLLLFVNKNGVPINVQMASMLDGDLIVSGTVTAAQIAAGTITANNISSGTITGSLIASNTILASNIAAGAIGTNQLAADAVTAGTVAANAITSTAIAADAITADKIAAGAVTTEKLTVGSLGSNLILNPAFEDVTDSGNLANWRPNWSGGTAPVGSSTATVISGSRSGLISPVSTFGDLSSNAFPVVAGQTYYVKARVATSVNGMAQSLYVYFGSSQGFTSGTLVSGVPTVKNVHVQDNNGVDQTGFTSDTIAGRARLVNSWAGAVANNVYTMSGQVVAPTGASWAVVTMQSLGGTPGNVYWDDIECDGVLIAAVIGDGAITASKISAGAIDGQTITGAILQTASSGNRVLIHQNTSGTSQGEILYYNSAGAILGSITTATDGLLAFTAPNPLIRMSVSNSGCVFTGFPNITFNGLVVVNDSPLNIYSDAASHRVLTLNGAGGSQTASYLTVLSPSGSTISQITSTGNVQGTGAYTSLSDRTVKREIDYLTDQEVALDAVRKLKPARFKYQDADDVHIGFIAQDVVDVLPDAVVPFGDPHDETDLENGDARDGSGLLGLQTDVILANVVLAVRHLAQRVDHLTKD